MKKWMTWLLTGLLLIGTLTGCGKAKEDGGGSTEPVEIRVGSLKGPTSMGLVWLMDRQEQGLAKNEYTFTMEATADMLLPQVISGELDLVLVPANVASVLYHKTDGGVSVIDINTLGVLYLVSADNTISKMEDLKGRTI